MPRPATLPAARAARRWRCHTWGRGFALAPGATVGPAPSPAQPLPHGEALPRASASWLWFFYGAANSICPAAVTSQHFVSPSVPAVGLSLLASRQHLPPPMALCPRVLPRQDFQGLYLKPSSVRLTIRGLPDSPVSEQ